MRPGAVVAVAFAVLAGLLVGCGSDTDADAVEYEATELRTGEEVSVADLRGEPALLVSWATWCNECEEELAGLARFAESDATEGLEIVTVNLDAADVEDDIDAKLDGAGLDDVALWRDRRNEFKRSFGALGVPTTVVLDADGRVAGTFPGAVDFDDAEVLEVLDAVRAEA